MDINLSYFYVPVIFIVWAVMLEKNKFTFKIGNRSILLMIWKILSVTMFFFTFLAIYHRDYKYLDIHRKIWFNGISPVMLLVLIEISFSKRKK